MNTTESISEMDKQDNLIYKLDDIEGVQIDVLCKSLKAIENEYQRFTNNKKTLVVKEIRKGSGIVELMEYVIVPSLILMESTNTILQFAEYLGTVKDVILKKQNKRLPDGVQLTPSTVNNINSIIAPVVNGDNNIFNIYVGEQKEPAMSVGQNEYKEIKRASRQKLIDLKSENDYLSEDTIYEKVLFQWVQTRFNSTKVGNRGVVKRIQDKDVKVIFADDNSATKTEMTTSTLGVDWQVVKYIVDVEAIVDNNHIVAYKILKNYPEDSIVELDNDSVLF